MNKHIILERFYTPFATLGRMRCSDKEWATIEKKWLYNEKNISCIPEGTYTCKRYDSPRHGPTFEVKNVPNRSYILFHVANLESELEGCIGVSETYHPTRYAIKNSRVGFGDFLESLSDVNEFTLTIRQYRPY